MQDGHVRPAGTIHAAASRRVVHERLGRSGQEEVPEPPPVHWPTVSLPDLRPE